MEGLESFYTSGQQLEIFLLSCLFGVPIGIVYDAFRALRMTVPHGRAAVFFEDVFFFLLYGVFLVCFSISFSRSEFRFYYILGSGIGFAVYFFTVGKFVNAALRMVIGIVKKIFKKLALICRKITGKFVRSLQKKKEVKKTDPKHLIDEGDLLYNYKEDIETEQKKKRKEREKI